MENFTVGNIVFEPTHNSFKPFATTAYREILEKMVEQAKKEKHSLNDVMSDIVKKWQGWDN